MRLANIDKAFDILLELRFQHFIEAPAEPCMTTISQHVIAGTSFPALH